MNTQEKIDAVKSLAQQYPGDEASLLECLGDILVTYKEHCGCEKVESKIARMLEILDAHE